MNITSPDFPQTFASLLANRTAPAPSSNANASPPLVLECRWIVDVSEAEERRGRDVLERHVQLAVAELELLDARRLTDATSAFVSGAELDAINCNMSSLQV